MLTGLVAISVFLICVVPSGDVKAEKKTGPAHVWWARDSLWAIGGFGAIKESVLQRILAVKPKEIDCFKGYELQLREKGVWLGFGVALRKVDRVVFTKATKVVLYDRSGRRVESEAIIFYPDEYQTAVYDNRKGPVVVTARSIWSFENSGQPSGVAKFPLGSIKADEIVNCEVVGAIADTTQRATR